MADITWPASLPFLNTGWTMTPADNVLRSQPERGPAKTRRKTSSKTKNYSGSIFLTSSELDTFLEFAEDTLKDCALSFSYPDYMTGLYASARITGYSITHDGRHGYDVEIELEILP